MGKGIGMLFEYETQKIVQINSTKVGIINRIIQVIIVGYIICWVMIYEKGYQDTDAVVSAVTTKVKGIGYTNITNNPTYGFRTWDVADYVVPPQENNAFFVITNAVITPKQSPGTCLESADVQEGKCLNDFDCKNIKSLSQASGLFTGRCIRNNNNTKSGICEVRGWCPVENDSMPIYKKPLFPMVRDYTVLIKNDIEFPKFKVKRRNILDWSGKKFLSKCKFDPKHQENKYCPIFNLGKIFDIINSSNAMLYKGGVIAINIDWQCNLDWNVKYCNPKYTFRRLDDENAKIASGLNFRFAYYYRVNGKPHRDLIKAFGVRFLVFVTGKAGKFSIIPLTMNLGSGLALLGLASVLCDMIVLHLLGSKEVYRSAKFETVENDDDTKNDDPKESTKGLIQLNVNNDTQEFKF